MSLGSLARAVLGDRLFPVLGRRYRALFVDLERVVSCLPSFPPGAHVLDIGGGDGEMMNRILELHPEIDVTMLDSSPRLGAFLKPELRSRVRLLPSTTLATYAGMEHRHPDFVLVSDVFHHIPVPNRPDFLADLRAVLAGRPTTLIVKDVEPGYVRSFFARLADRYVSGDRNVELVGEEQITALVRATFSRVEVRGTELLRLDKPNYAVVFAVEG